MLIESKDKTSLYKRNNFVETIPIGWNLDFQPEHIATD